MKKRIVLADDEENLRILVRTTLEDPNYEIFEAPDGLAALALAQQCDPDLMVLDWMMPGMTGLEVTSHLRADPRTQSIPIILLTAKGQEEDRAKGRESGVNEYLVKPFSPMELLTLVMEMLG